MKTLQVLNLKSSPRELFRYSRKVPHHCEALRGDPKKESLDRRCGKVVVIENQFGLTDHIHLGQIITYLTSLDAKRAI